MRILLRPAIALIGASACVSGAASAQTDGMAALDSLGSALRSAAAWRAAYVQTYIPAGMTDGETLDGTVVVAWPDHALFLTGDPVTQKMGLDGRLVRLIDLEAGSCDEHRIDDEEWSRIPLAAVLDPATAVDRFTVIDGVKGGFRLVPREAGGVAEVRVEPGPDAMPTVVVIVDPQGATNHLRFTAWQQVERPAEDAWLPTPPSGVECVTDAP